MLGALLGRSGFMSLIMTVTGLSKAAQATSSQKTHYSTSKPWSTLQTEQGLNFFQACMVALAKLTFWHVAQIFWFVLNYISYRPMMSATQFIFATCVLMKEAIYGVMLLFGVILAPRFLLFTPLSDADFTFRVAYLLSPDGFVADTISMSLDHSSRCAVVALTMQSMAFVSAGLSCAAWPALCIGFIEGVMTPALALGYVLAGLTPVGLLWAYVFPRLPDDAAMERYGGYGYGLEVIEEDASEVDMMWGSPDRKGIPKVP